MAKPLSCVLVTIQTEEGLTRKVVHQNPFMIGRSLESAISLADPNVSRAHLSVKNKGGKVWIKDQNSGGGTFVNSEKIDPQKMIPIEPEDIIRIGNTSCVVSFAVVDVAIGAEILSEMQLPPDKRDAVINMMQGAYHEAQRLVEMGRQIHDESIRRAQEKVNEIEDELAAQREQVIEAATARVKETRLKMLNDAEHEVEEILSQQHERCAEVIAQMNVKIDDMKTQAEKEAARIKSRAEEDAGILLNEAQIESERRVSELLNNARSEAQKQARKLEESTIEKTTIECNKMVKEAEAQANVFRLERKREEADWSLQRQQLHEEIEGLKIEHAHLKEILERQRRVANEEMTHQKEMHQREMQSLYEANQKATAQHNEQRRSEIEKFKIHKEEEARVFVQEKMLEFEKQKYKYENEFSELRKQIEKIQPEAEELTTKVKTLQEKESKAQKNLAAAKEEHKSLLAEVKQFNSEKKSTEARLKEIEIDIGKMSVERDNLAQGLVTLKETTAAKLKEQKEKIDSEFEKLSKTQQEELDNLRLAELERTKRECEQAIENFVLEKSKIGEKIQHIVVEEFVRSKGTSLDPEVSSNLRERVNAIVEDHSISMLAQHHSGGLTTDKVRDRVKRQRHTTLAQGVAAGMLTFYLGTLAYHEFEADFNPMKTAAELQAKLVQEDLARRKFAPEQSYEWRDTYAQLVIYTKDFVPTYTSSEFQHDWGTAATKYLLTQWRLEEEKAIEVISMANTLVTTLAEKKEAIHPDYVDQGLQKMDELELEITTRMKDLLGSEVRYEALRRFEKKFYEEYTTQKSQSSMGGASSQ